MKINYFAKINKLILPVYIFKNKYQNFPLIYEGCINLRRTAKFVIKINPIPIRNKFTAKF